MAPAELIPTLAVVTAAAALAPVVATLVPGRILPIIVVEIVLGIVAGQSGLRWIEPNAVLAVLSALGFAMLMFVSGTEIDLKILLCRAATTRAGSHAIRSLGASSSCWPRFSPASSSAV